MGTKPSIPEISVRSATPSIEILPSPPWTSTNPFSPDFDNSYDVDTESGFHNESPLKQRKNATPAATDDERDEQPRDHTEIVGPDGPQTQPDGSQSQVVQSSRLPMFRYVICFTFTFLAGTIFASALIANVHQHYRTLKPKPKPVSNYTGFMGHNSQGSGQMTMMVDVAVIKSLKDLKNLKVPPSIIEILRLTSKMPTNSKELLARDKQKFHLTVNYLRILGETSEEWLLYLVDYLTELNTLHLNVNALCDGSGVKDRTELRKLEHSKLRHLIIEDSTMCKIIEWVFEIRVKELKTVRFTRVKFSKGGFNRLLDFIKRYKDGLELMELRNCVFSVECNTTQINEEMDDKIKWIDETESGFNGDHE